MCTSATTSYVVILNHQREQLIRHLKAGGSVSIAPCRIVPKNCTVIENGQVVVKPVYVQPVEETVETVAE